MRVVSLFSGAGGLDLGFIQAGHSIVWANDNDPDSCATYANNIGDHIVCADVAKINSSTIPTTEIIIGGFPCQGFSQANLLRNADDERNKLYKHYLKFLKHLKPKFFLAENVRGILSLEGGAAFQQILKDFQSAGYRTEYSVLNAADYGVPQRRIRVFIVGIRKNLASDLKYYYPDPTHSKDSTNSLLPWISISDALRDVPDPVRLPGVLPNQEYSKYKVTSRNFTGHRSTDPNKPSPTILARGNAGGGVCAIQHPSNKRRMSVRESAVIQTFPKKFEFIGRMNSCYRQVGNAVPVLLARKIAESFSKLEEQLFLTEDYA